MISIYSLSILPCKQGGHLRWVGLPTKYKFLSLDKHFGVANENLVRDSRIAKKPWIILIRLFLP